jgi:hypothetical protein
VNYLLSLLRYATADSPFPSSHPGLSAHSTIDLSQESPPPSDCKRSHGLQEDRNEREDEYDCEDLKTGIAPAAARKPIPAADQSERAQFWASIGSDDSDTEGEEEEDADAGMGYDHQLDLDRNGENGGCFESSSFSIDEEEGPVRGPKSGIRVVRTSILMGRDYYSRPGEGEKNGVCQSRCLTDEDYAEQLHRERDTAYGQVDKQSIGVKMYPTMGTGDGDSDGADTGSENPYRAPKREDVDIDAEGGATAENMSDGEVMPSGCGAAPSRDSSPALAEQVSTSSAALPRRRFSIAQGNHMRLPEECNRDGSEGGDDHNDKSCGDSDSDSDSVTVKALRTPRDPGSRPILEPATLSHSGDAARSPGIVRSSSEEAGWASGGDTLDGVRGHGAEGMSVSDSEREKIATFAAEVEVEDLEEEAEAEAIIEGQVEAATWSAEDSSDSEGAEGVSEEALEGEEEGSLEEVLCGRTARDVSGDCSPCDSEYAAFSFSANDKGPEQDAFEACQESVSESCQQSEEVEEEPSAVSETGMDLQDKCDQSRGFRMVESAGMGEQETASSAASVLSRSDRRCSSWTALSPGAARGDLDLDSDPNLEAHEGTREPSTPSRRSYVSAHPCPASSAAKPLNRAASSTSSGGQHSPTRPASGAGAAYHTPGRIVLHVATPHSSRGFCVALDSDSDSDGEEGSNSNPHCDSSPPGDDEGEEDGEGDGDRDTISPLGRSPLPMSRDKDTAEWSSPFSLPMSPMSASTINSAVTSFSLSPHAIRSLALARLNLGTESNLKLCPSTMAPQTGKNFRGSRACDLVRIRLAGTAFEASPPRERESLLASIQEPSAASEAIHCSAGAKVTKVADRYDGGRGIEESALEIDEMSEADTVHLDCGRDNPSPTPTPARNAFQKGNHSGAGEDEDEDEWVPKSACRQRLVKLSYESEASSAGDGDSDEKDGSISIVSAMRSPAAALALPGALRGQRDRSLVINLEDSDDDDADVVVVPVSRGGRGNGAAARSRSVIIDSDSDEESYDASGSAVVSSARTGARGYDRMSDLEPGGRGRGRGGEVIKRRHRDDEGGESDSGDDELDCGDDSVEEEELEDEDSDSGEEHVMNFSDEALPSSKCKERAFLEYSAIDVVPLMDIARETGTVHADLSADKENRSVSVNLAFRGPVHRPAHSVTAKQKRLYNQRVLEAQSSEGQRDLEPALESYLAALEICDADPALHGKMAFLSRELDYF